MATMTDLAKDAFSVMICDPFECELFERYLREVQESTTAEERASGSGVRQRKPFSAAISGGGLKEWPANTDAGRLNRLKQLTELLIATVISRRLGDPSFSLNKMCSDSCSVVDPLCCPVCEDVLRYPVTATCGHTFCRQCCFGRSQCTVCSQQFPTISSSANGSASLPLMATVTSGSSSVATLTLLPSSTGPTSTATSSSSLAMATVVTTTATNHDKHGPDLAESGGSASAGSVIGFEQDILVRRLVERWWGPELKAAEFNEEAQRHLEGDALDEALRCCNQSLEYANQHQRKNA